MKTVPDKRWEAFASREPFFAVLTHEKFLRANFDAGAEREFFESGEQHVAALFDTIRTHVSSTFAAASALEYGCGAGRLAIPLARRIGAVTAVDVSDSMLRVAREQASKAGVTKIAFQPAHEFLAGDRKFDLVTLHLVLQRMPPPEGLDLLRVLANRVGYGGVGVVHVPFRKHSTRAVELTRWARAHVPGVNAAMNVARRKAIPFFPTHTYELNDVFAILQDAGFDQPYVVISRSGDVDAAMLYAERRSAPGGAAGALARRRASENPAGEAPAAPQKDFIDVREMIGTTSIEELNRTAEAYFSSLTDWEHHLAKPLSKAEETPPLLINLGVLLQGLELMPGQTVVDYGAGSGWLSRYLTQLGARMVLLDVSPTALDIARETYRRLPVVGERPEPRFLVYDGHTIDLPDESVDRIVCFDAFHHAPNPGAVLREFGRILKPGGIAAFAEPGPHHSMTPQSQFEMRTYGVVENDVDVRAIWNDAQKYGFVDLKLAAWHLPVFHVRLDEYEDLLAGGETYSRFAQLNRTHLRNVRNFFLRKAGVESVDSRRADALRCTIDAELVSVDPMTVRATVTNSGAAVWLPPDEPVGGVALGCHLYDAEGRLLRFDHHWARLTAPPRPILPSEIVTITFTLPPLEPGTYELEFDCVAQKVAWFTQVGSTTARIRVTV